MLYPGVHDVSSAYCSALYIVSTLTVNCPTLYGQLSMYHYVQLPHASTSRRHPLTSLRNTAVGITAAIFLCSGQVWKHIKNLYESLCYVTVVIQQ